MYLLGTSTLIFWTNVVTIRISCCLFWNIYSNNWDKHSTIQGTTFFFFFLITEIVSTHNVVSETNTVILRPKPVISGKNMTIFKRIFETQALTPVVKKKVNIMVCRWRIVTLSQYWMVLYFKHKYHLRVELLVSITHHVNLNKNVWAFI